MVATRITVDEFEATCGDERVELIDGMIVPMTPASYEPSTVTATITILLGMHVRPRKLGRVLSAEAGFVLFPDRDTVLAPDVACVRAGREPQGAARWHFARLAPDLVVEVLSPSDRASDMEAKVAMYQEAGASVVWIVDPQAETVKVLALGQPPVILTATDTLDGGGVLPDFQVEVAEFFNRRRTASPAKLSRASHSLFILPRRRGSRLSLASQSARFPCADQLRVSCRAQSRDLSIADRVIPMLPRTLGAGIGARQGPGRDPSTALKMTPKGGRHFSACRPANTSIRLARDNTRERVMPHADSPLKYTIPSDRMCTGPRTL